MIIYAAVSRNEVVLTEHSTASMQESNLVTITQMVLSKLAGDVEEGSRKSFVYKSLTGKVEALGEETSGAPAWTTIDVDKNAADVQDYFFHLVKELHGVVYLCLADDSRRVDRHYRFLEDLQEAFTKKFKKRVILKANAYAMEKKFSSKIGELVHHFNTHPDIADIDRSAVVAAMDKAEKVKTVMGENIRRSMNAQEHTNKLRRQSELIRQDSIVFKKKTKKVKGTMRYSYTKYNWAITIAIFTFLYIAFAYKCGLTGSICLENMKQRRQGGNKNNQVNDDNIDNSYEYDDGYR